MPPYPLRVRFSSFSVRFMLYIVSEDAQDGKGTKQKTLGFQSLLLLARLDRVLAREDHHETDDDEEDEEGDRLAVHAPIIARSPGNASPCSGFRASFWRP